MSPTTLHLINGLTMVNGENGDLVRIFNENTIGNTPKKMKSIPTSGRTFEWLNDDTKTPGFISEYVYTYL